MQETDPGSARTFRETEGHSRQTDPPSAQTTGIKGLHFQSKFADNNWFQYFTINKVKLVRWLIKSKHKQIYTVVMLFREKTKQIISTQHIPKECAPQNLQSG